MNIKAVVSKVENHIYWKKIEWGFYDKMDDESFLKMAYKRKFGKELDLKNPVTFNEKLQWLKLHDRKPEYTTMVDKYEAKAYIAQKIGEEYVVPTLGVWEKFDDIDFTKLPNAAPEKCGSAHSVRQQYAAGSLCGRRQDLPDDRCRHGEPQIGPVAEKPLCGAEPPHGAVGRRFPASLSQCQCAGGNEKGF